MKAIIQGLENFAGNNDQVDVVYGFFDGMGGGSSSSATINIGGVQSVTDLNATIQTAVLNDASSRGFSGFSASDILWSIPVSRSFSNPSLAINTARQASTTRDAFVSASVDITASLSLTTGQKGTVTLQYADDSGFTTNVKTVQPMTNGNTGTLAIGLALGQMVTATVSGIVPAAKYYRLLTTNNTGTPTYGTPAIQEVLL